MDDKHHFKKSEETNDIKKWIFIAVETPRKLLISLDLMTSHFRSLLRKLTQIALHRYSMYRHIIWHFKLLLKLCCVIYLQTEACKGKWVLLEQHVLQISFWSHLITCLPMHVWIDLFLSWNCGGPGWTLTFFDLPPVHYNFREGITICYLCY